MITMNDIARLAGTARSTVHAVLTGKSWVSEKTKTKVMEIVERYNYHPNKMAASLGGRASHLVAIILKDILNPFNSLIVEGITGLLKESGYSPLILSTMDDHDTEVQAIQAAIGYQVDGIIITPQQVGVDLGHLHRLKETGKPLVTLGRLPGLETNYVEVDEEEIGRTAASYLLDRGFRKIVFIRGPRTSGAAKERVTGFKSELAARGIPANGETVVYGGATITEGYSASLSFLQDKTARPEAVICYNDLVAAGVYKACHDLDISIPEGLSVIGIDNIELAEVFGPPLTTIEQPSLEMGRKMAHILIEKMQDSESGDFQHVRLHTRVVERNSVKNRNSIEAD
jgi:DNA-binding LacI/PurR family transcriptional regulator